MPTSPLPTNTPSTKMSTPETYRVYRASETGIPFNHQTIFVETHENGPKCGHIYHVTGTIQNGMAFEHRPADELEKSPMFGSKTLVGTISREDFPGRFLEVCESVPPPKKQFEGNKRLFPSEPLRRCGQWADETVVILGEAGVLRKEV